MKACTVCASKVIGDPGGYDICPICHWEDEGGLSLDESSMANGGRTLRQARARFLRSNKRLRGIVEFPHDEAEVDQEMLEEIKASVSMSKEKLLEEIGNDLPRVMDLMKKANVHHQKSDHYACEAIKGEAFEKYCENEFAESSLLIDGYQLLGKLWVLLNQHGLVKKG